MKEQWKTIYRNYSISNTGQLKNKHGKLLSDNTLTNGYIKNCLAYQGNQIYRHRHKLVAMAFLEHTPCGYNEVIDHKDNNKLNNYANNLRRSTARYNVTKDIGGVSKYIGVQWYKASSKWRVAIEIEGRKYSLGLFYNEQYAAKQYQDALSAWTNWGIIPKIWTPNERRYYKPHLKY